MITGEVDPRYLIKYNITKKECEKREHILLTRVALLESYRKISGGYENMDDEELEYVQNAKLDAEYELLMMHGVEADMEYEENKEQILFNLPPLYL